MQTEFRQNKRNGETYWFNVAVGVCGGIQPHFPTQRALWLSVIFKAIKKLERRQ